MKSLCILLCVLSTMAFAQVPVNPNKTDASGKRQGSWTILMDKNFVMTSHPDSAIYYRIATYKDDKPVSIVRDYQYKTGIIQFEGMIIEDVPKVIFDGKATWYNEQGQKEFEAVMKGEQVAGTYAIYAEDGTVITEPTDSLNKRGRDLYKLQKFPEAIVFFKQASVKAKYEFGDNSLKHAVMLANTALSYSKMNDYISAGPYSMKSVEIYRQLGDTGSANYINVVAITATYWQLQKQFEKAETLFREVLTNTEKLSGKASDSYLIRLMNLGICLVRGEKYAEAKPIYLELRSRLEKPGYQENRNFPSDYAATMLRLGTIDVKLRQLTEGKKVYEDLLAYITDKPGYEKIQSDLPRIIEKLNATIAKGDDPVTRGVQFRNEGKYDEAEPELEAGLKERMVKFGDKDARTAIVVYYLGLNNSDLAHYEKSIQYFNKYLNTYESLGLKNSIEYASGLGSKGVAFLKAGKIAESEPLILDAYTMGASFRESRPREYGIIIYNVSRYYLETKNFPKAEAFNLEALALLKKTAGTDNLFYAELLNQLGVTYISMGAYDKAKPVLEESLGIFEKKIGKGSSNYGIAEQNLAMVYQNLGEGKKSSELFWESFITKISTLGPDHPEYATALNGLGTQAILNGNYQDAKVFLLNAKEVLEKSIGKNHPNYIMAISNLALAYELSHDDRTAEKYYDECLVLLKKQLNNIFPSLSETEKKKYYDNLIPFFQNYGNFVLSTYTHDNGGRRIGDWYNWRMETKGLLFHASTQLRQRIINSGDPQLISKFKTWQFLRDSLAKSYQRPNGENNKNISKLEEQANQLEKEMSRYSEAFRKSSENKTYSWKDVQKHLKPGEAAVELIRMEVRTKDEDDGHYDYDPAYVALIVKFDTKSNPELLILADADKMEGAHFKKYKNSIRYGLSDVTSYDIFWKPIAKKLNGASKVYFSADGVYHLINLATINNTEKTTPAKPKAYLQDEIDIEIVLSTKDLITGAKNPDALDKVILFGFPNYNNSKQSIPVNTDRGLQLDMPTKRELQADTSQRFFTGDNIAELPGTKKEVENIQVLLKNKSVNYNAYLFDNASEAEIKRIQNPSVLHVATHGYFLGDEAVSKNTLSAVSTSTNPLMRSGLLFSGAKFAFQGEGATTSGEDGVLTSLEATGLRLDQTRLVVLSACETGLGVISNGDGVYGLQRSFQLAGAKAVLMSLWTVPDEATQELMTEFYSQWLQGTSLREALKKAQAKVRLKHPDPHDWGGFVLIGN